MGGIVPPARKHATIDLEIQNAIIPATAVVSMLQHFGLEARPIVLPGERVREGMIIGDGSAPGSAHVHAPIPGKVRAVDPLRLPDGRLTRAITIDMEGEFDQLGKRPDEHAWQSLSLGKIREAITSAGLVGMGTDSKPLDGLLAGGGCETLVVNGCESQPYLTTAHAMLLSHAPQILTGAFILARLLRPRQILVTVGPGNEPAASVDAASATLRTRKDTPSLRAVKLSETYPQEDVRQLVRSVTGREIPSGQDARSLGVSVVDVAAAFAVHEAIVRGRPLVERVVTVSGGAVRAPANVKVRLGTSLGDLIADCGGFATKPASVLVGGPLTGYATNDLLLPVTKETRAVLALTRRELHLAAERPCINCGRCVDACPMGLNPARLFRLLDYDRISEAEDEGLRDCTLCGACGYACPSRIPLVSVFRDRIVDGSGAAG